MRDLENSFGVFGRFHVPVSQPAQVRGRHILIRIDPSKPASNDEAKKKIGEIAEKAKTEDFAKLAQTYSDDPGSKSKGGDLGYFTRERMVPEFANAAFAAEVGKVTGPIKTDFGYHLIKVTGLKDSEVVAFDQIKDQVKASLLQQKQSTTFNSKISQWKIDLNVKTYEDKL